MVAKHGITSSYGKTNSFVAGPAQDSVLSHLETEALQRAQIRLMYEHARMAVLANLLLGAVVFWTLWDNIANPPLLAWFCLLAVTVAIRIAIQNAYVKFGINSAAHKTWNARYVSGALLNGATWGLLGVAFNFAQSIEHQVVIAFVLCAQATSAIPVLSSARFGYPLFVLFVLGPVTVSALAQGEQVYLAIGTTTILVAIMLMVIARSFRANIERVHRATHDTLTDLVNRTEFERRLTRMHEQTINSETVHALLLLNLDQFKLINDSCGHVAGDEMLREIAKVLSERIRSRDTLARTGGDEFAVILENCDLVKAREVAQSIRYAIAQYRYQWNQRSYRVNASIGLVPISRHQKSSSDIMRDALAALYTAKDSGRNSIHVSDENDRAILQRREQMKWAEKITEALEKNRFNIFAQPIHHVGARGPDGGYVEILLRLTDDDDQIIPAGEFLPAAESYGLMPLLDRWVIRKTFSWLAEDAIGEIDRCAINLSGTSLGSEGFMRFVHEQFDMYRIHPSRVVFEITESSLIENIDAAKQFMREFKQHGCRFALDDFGKGLSSFGYLKNLEVDILKIDGMFVRDMLHDDIDNTLVKAINNIGHELGIETVAEFVENDMTLEALTEIGVDYVQGYALGMPTAVTTRSPLHDMFDARAQAGNAS